MEKSILLLTSEHFRSNLLSFDTFSKFEMTPPHNIFNGDPHFFLTEKKNNHTNIIYKFVKISRVRFLITNQNLLQT